MKIGGGDRKRGGGPGNLLGEGPTVSSGSKVREEPDSSPGGGARVRVPVGPGVLALRQHEGVGGGQEWGRMGWSLGAPQQMEPSWLQ